MKLNVAIRAGLAGVALAIALPAVAAPAKSAPYRFRSVETWGWKASLPDNMTQVGKVRTDPKNPHLAKWKYESESRSIRLLITTKKNVKRKFADIAKYNYLTFAKKKPKMTVLRMRQFKSGKRKVAYFLASNQQIRNKKMHTYVYLRMVVRANRALAYLQLGVADDKLDQFEEIADKLISSFNLAEPASVAKEVRRKGGKVAIVNDMPEEKPAAKAAGKK